MSSKAIAALGTVCAVIIAIGVVIALNGGDNTRTIEQHTVTQRIGDATSTSRTTETTKTTTAKHRKPKIVSHTTVIQVAPQTVTQTAAAASGGTADANGLCPGTNIYVDRNTCGFAQNVYDAYFATGLIGDDNVIVTAFSPATSKEYTLTCSGAGQVTCTAGSDLVQFPA